MPGVLIVEALAQTGAVLVMHDPANAELLPFFARIDNCRFRQPVRPGDTLRLEVDVTSFRPPVGKAHGRALVGEQLGVRGGPDVCALQANLSHPPSRCAGGSSRRPVRYCDRVCGGQAPTCATYC